MSRADPMETKKPLGDWIRGGLLIGAALFFLVSHIALRPTLYGLYQSRGLELGLATRLVAAVWYPLLPVGLVVTLALLSLRQRPTLLGPSVLTTLAWVVLLSSVLLFLWAGISTPLQATG